MNFLHTIIPKNLADRFSLRAKRAIEESTEIAKQYPSLTFSKKGVILSIEPEHLLYALWKEKGGIARNTLEAHHVGENDLTLLLTDGLDKKSDLGTLIEYASLKKEEDTKTSSHYEIASSLKKIFKKAVVEASAMHSPYIGTEHLLLATLSQHTPLFEEKKTEEIRKHLSDMLSSASRFSHMHRVLERENEAGNALPPHSKTERRVSPQKPLRPKREKDKTGNEKTKKSKGGLAIEFFCQDITEKAERGELDPLVGREQEVNRIIHILSRRTKNNPVLVGQPGVGKTAIVQGLAQRIASGEVPDRLLNQRILALDLGLLVSGTIFRGEFEARLKDIVKELKETGTILFIDEIHTIIGAGSAQGSLDAADLLKPELSGGNLQCIGATTPEEYRKYFERDRALERRFQAVPVEELKEKETIQVLGGLKPLYEEHHRIKIENAALEAATRLAARYLTDRFLPDKAIDLMDEAASRLTLKNTRFNRFSKAKLLERERTKTGKEKERAIQDEDYEKALLLKTREEKLDREIESSLKRAREADRETRSLPLLTANDIQELVAEITGIPLKTLGSDEKKRLTRLERHLASYIKGQEKALTVVAAAIRRQRAGIANPRRPIASFLFLGPTGIGKTETARVLAEALSPSKRGKTAEPPTLIKLDMSEFSEPHSISKLIGAPPGYVGYEDHGSIFERLKRAPFGVILFDEIEKAHPQLFHILLQILEDGTLTLSDGATINFKNTIIIMTSNVGTEEFTREGIRLGFRPWEDQHTGGAPKDSRVEEITERTLEELRRIMRPELVNRIDHVVVFNALGEKEVRDIVKLQLENLKEKIKELYELTYSPAVVAHIARISLNPKEGARRIRRNIETLIEDPIAQNIIDGKIQKGDGIILHLEGETLVISPNKKSGSL